MNQALLNAKNITVVTKNDIIEAIKPKPDYIKCNMSIKGVPGNIQNDLKLYIQSQVQPDDIVDFTLNAGANLILIFLKDEQSATNLFNILHNQQFKNITLTCSLESTSLYIKALDSLQKMKSKGGNIFVNRYPFPYNAGGYYNQFSGGYPMYSKNTGGYGSYNGDSYRGKKYPGGRRGNYRGNKPRNYNGDNKNLDQNFVVDEKDFPPLDPNES